MKFKTRLAFFFAALCALVPLALFGWGEKRVKMEARAPTCGMEVEYRRTSQESGKSEVYKVFAKEIEVGGEKAYQSVSAFDDRIRRVTMRASDLTPIASIEEWKDEKKFIKRLYGDDKARVIREGVPYPMDVVVEAARGVHDTESFAFLLKGYPFGEKDSLAPVDVLVAEPNALLQKPRVFSIYLIPLGTEKIKVPAGEFECYKFRMTLAGALGYVVPDNYFWLLKDDPHLVVMGEGGGEKFELMSGPYSCQEEGRCTAEAAPPELWPG